MIVVRDSYLPGAKAAQAEIVDHSRAATDMAEYVTYLPPPPEGTQPSYLPLPCRHQEFLPSPAPTFVPSASPPIHTHSATCTRTSTHVPSYYACTYAHTHAHTPNATHSQRQHRPGVATDPRELARPPPDHAWAGGPRSQLTYMVHTQHTFNDHPPMRQQWFFCHLMSSCCQTGCTLTCTRRIRTLEDLVVKHFTLGAIPPPAGSTLTA